jgi:hypothetical protein
MGAEDLLYRMDPKKIRVSSGDITHGYWELHSMKLERSSELFKCSTAASCPSEEINLAGQITSLELKNIEDANPAANMVGIGVGALAGLRFFGPIGAIGGAVAGQLLVGNRHEVTVEVLLNDGRKFQATMDKSIYQRLKAIHERVNN